MFLYQINSLSKSKFVPGRQIDNHKCNLYEKISRQKKLEKNQNRQPIFTIHSFLQERKKGIGNTLVLDYKLKNVESCLNFPKILGEEPPVDPGIGQYFYFYKEHIYFFVILQK